MKSFAFLLLIWTFSLSNSIPHNDESLQITSSPNCGVSNTPSDVRIIGGQPTPTKQFPWIVLLKKKIGEEWFHHCGGSIVNQMTIVTAAHCVIGLGTENIRAVVGANRRSGVNPPQVNHDVSEVIMHQQFNPRTFLNDIALLKLSAPIKINTSAHGVCLPTTGQQFTGMLTVVGWGSTEEGGDLAEELRFVNLPLVSNVRCRRLYGVNSIRDGNVCAGHDDGGSGFCNGDGGGPLVQMLNDRHFLVGVSSWGHGCARRDYPGVYTYISYYRQWIDSNARFDSR